MKVGLISDTHNHLPETRRALDLLLKHGATHLVHCGDAGEDVIDLLSATCMEHGIRAHVALGNCDSWHDAPYAPQPEGVERGSAPEFELANIRCVVMHGHDTRRLRQAKDSGEFDYIFTGHTHRAMEKQVGPTRVINPGSPVRPRGGLPSVALLNLDSGEVVWLTC